MKCDYKKCTTEMGIPPLTIMVGDIKAGAYWGNYCSYDCVLAEFTHTWKHLKEGKPLATADTTNNTLVPTSTNAAPPAATIPPIQQNVNVQAPVAQQNANPAEDMFEDQEEGVNLFTDQPTEEPAPIQEDGMAWGGTPVPQSTFNADLAQKIETANDYAKVLGVKVAESFGKKLGGAGGIIPVDGHNYETFIYSFSANYQLYNFDVDITVNVDEGTPKVVIRLPNATTDYTAKIDPSTVPLDKAVAPMVDHLKGVGKIESDKAANTQVAAAGANDF